MRPLSEFKRTGTFALTLTVCSGDRPAMVRRIGAINLLKVNVADVGNPGKIAAGVPSSIARQSGFPGLSATPCTKIPGLLYFSKTR